MNGLAFVPFYDIPLVIAEQRERHIAYELNRRRYAPDCAAVTEEKPASPRYERCKDCPYPSHGFVCWRDEDHCLRTEMEKINRREKEKREHERSIEQPATPGIRSGDDPPADTV